MIKKNKATMNKNKIVDKIVDKIADNKADKIADNKADNKADNRAEKENTIMIEIKCLQLNNLFRHCKLYYK